MERLLCTNELGCSRDMALRSCLQSAVEVPTAGYPYGK